MRDFLTQLRQAGRAWRRRPLYATISTVAVALGVAISTASFVLVDAALVAPLPFPDSAALVTADAISPEGHSVSLSVPNFRDWRERNRVFSTSAASTGWDVILAGHGPARVLEAREVYGDYFGLLGLRAAAGRTFGPEETERGAPPVAVLSHHLWSQLGETALPIGSTLTLDGMSYTIVGVLPAGAGYPSSATDLYLPLGALGDRLPWDDRDSSFGLRFLARMRPGVDLARAQEDLDRVARETREAAGRDVARPRLRTLADLLVGDLRTPLGLLLGASGLVVALAIANVANLFLARGEARRSEVALRSALGASRLALARLYLGESGWIGGVGGLLGLGGAAVIVPILASRAGAELPGFVRDRLHLGASGIGWAALLALVTILVLGLLPVLVFVRGGSTQLPQSSRSGGTRFAARFRSGLVIGELALGMVLLVGSLLLLASLDRLRRVDKGFSATGVVSGRLETPRGHFENAAAWLSFEQRALEAARALPGVDHAALSLLLPLSERSWEMGLTPEGVAWDPHKGDSVLYNVVSEDYFRTLQVPLVRGRSFDANDKDGAPLVTIVDESLAKRYWPGADPLGRRVTFEEDGDPHSPQARPVYRTIIGVARNVRHYELREPSRIQVYIPVTQTHGRSQMSLMLSVRTSGFVAPFVRLLSEATARVDAAVPLSDVRPLASYVDHALSFNELLGEAVSAYGSLAVLLAGVGVFALASFSVSQRAREIGLRQALGATPRSILGWICGQGLRWCAWGAAAGIPAAFVAALLGRALLFEVRPLDLASYLAAAALLGSVALVASIVPAVRAARIAPAKILREDA